MAQHDRFAGRSRRTVISTAVTVVLALILSAAGFALGTPEKKADQGPGTDAYDVTEPQETDTGETDPEEEKQPWTLDYVDAYGERHTAVIDPGLAMHDYDWDCLTKKKHGVLSYSDGRYRTRRGIDVSSHQGEIVWDEVRAAGIDFVFVRVVYRAYGSKGQLFADERARGNIRGAQEAGLDVGVYVFSQAVNEKEALEEAELTLEQLKGCDLQLPVVFDPETIRDDKARTDRVSGAQFTDNTIAFCERIRGAGYEPMIYSNMVWEDEMFEMDRLQDYSVWYADYEIPAQTPYAFTFWQYSEKGRVDGVQGAVDLNLEFVEEQL